MNKVLNRPMFRQQALRKGHLKPIKARVGEFIGPPTASQSFIGPKFPGRFEPIGPNPRMFSFNQRTGGYLTPYGLNRIRKIPGSFAGPVAMYSALDAAGVPAPVVGGIFAGELGGLALGMSKKPAMQTVSRMLTSPTRLAMRNPVLATAGLAATSIGRGYYDLAKQKELVKEYAKANNISEERAMNIFERDVAGDKGRKLSEGTFSDIAKTFNKYLTQSPTRAMELAKPLSESTAPGQKSEKDIANEIRNYASYVGQGGSRVYQDVDTLVKKYKSANKAVQNEMDEFRGPDDDYIYQNQASTNEMKLYAANTDLTAKIMFETGANPQKSANIAQAVINGDVDAKDIKKVADDDNLYVKVDNVSGDPNHPGDKKKEETITGGSDNKPKQPKGGSSGDATIDEGKSIAEEYDFNLKDLDPRKGAIDPKIVFLTKLAAGLLSGKTMQAGPSGFFEILGNALGPAIDSSILVKMKNDEAFRDFGSMVLDYNKDIIKERNEALGSGKYDLGSLEIDGQFYEAFKDKETQIVYSKDTEGNLRVVPSDVGQFYVQQNSEKYMDNIKLVADGALSADILRDQIALMKSPGGATATGASGLVLTLAETIGNLPGEIKDGVVGAIAGDFDQTGVSEEFEEKTDKVLDKFTSALEKKGNASQVLGKLKVNARMLTYTLANALKDKDRLTNRDLQLIEELTKTLGTEPDAKIIQKYEELLKRVEQKNQLRLNRFYTMGYTGRDVEGILKSLDRASIVQQTAPEVFDVGSAFEAFGIQ